jgi:hypothetical protein
MLKRLNWESSQNRDGLNQARKTTLTPKSKVIISSMFIKTNNKHMLSCKNKWRDRQHKMLQMLQQVLQRRVRMKYNSYQKTLPLVV